MPPDTERFAFVDTGKPLPEFVKDDVWFRRDWLRLSDTQIDVVSTMSDDGRREVDDEENSDSDEITALPRRESFDSMPTFTGLPQGQTTSEGDDETITQSAKALVDAICMGLYQSMRANDQDARQVRHTKWVFWGHARSRAVLNVIFNLQSETNVNNSTLKRLPLQEFEDAVGKVVRYIDSKTTCTLSGEHVMLGYNEEHGIFTLIGMYETRREPPSSLRQESKFKESKQKRKKLARWDSGVYVKRQIERKAMNVVSKFVIKVAMMKQAKKL